MPSPDSLGASGRYIIVDLVTGPPTFPLRFQPLFVAKYPEDTTLTGQAVSRTIVATGGSGDITLIDTLGHEVDWTMAAGEANAVQAVAVADPGGVTEIKVFL